MSTLNKMKLSACNGNVEKILNEIDISEILRGGDKTTYTVNSLILDGYFLWGLCRVGVETVHILERLGLKFSEMLMKINENHSLSSRLLLDKHFEKYINENGKTFTVEERTKYFNILNVFLYLMNNNDRDKIIEEFFKNKKL